MPRSPCSAKTPCGRHTWLITTPAVSASSAPGSSFQPGGHVTGGAGWVGAPWRRGRPATAALSGSVARGALGAQGCSITKRVACSEYLRIRRGGSHRC